MKIKGKGKMESKVRSRVRKVFGDQLVWIEHGLGGTPGVPDCLFLPGEKEDFGLGRDKLLPLVVGLELKRFGEKPATVNQRKLAVQVGAYGMRIFSLRPCGKKEVGKWRLTMLPKSWDDFDMELTLDKLTQLPFCMWSLLNRLDEEQ